MPRASNPWRVLKTGAMLLFFLKKSMYVSSLHKRPCKISLLKKKKTCNRFHAEEKIVILARGPPTISSAFRCRLFRDIRTFGRAVEGSSVSPLTNTMGGLSGGRREMTHQESVVPLHSSSPIFVPELWPWIWPVAPVVLPSSLGKHTPSKAPVLHDARAQPCADCIVPLGAPDALLPAHLCQEPRCFSLEGASWGGTMLPHLFFCSCSAASSAPSRERPGPSRTRCASSLPCP